MVSDFCWVLLLLDVVTPFGGHTEASVIIKIFGAGLFMIRVCFHQVIRIVETLACGKKPTFLMFDAFFSDGFILTHHVVIAYPVWCQKPGIDWDFVVLTRSKYFCAIVIVWVKGSMCILNICGGLIVQTLCQKFSHSVFLFLGQQNNLSYILLFILRRVGMDMEMAIYEVMKIGRSAALCRTNVSVEVANTQVLRR